MRRTNTDTTHHLEWYFNHAPGVPSAWGALVDMAQSGAARQAHGGQSRTPTQRALSDAGRARDIEARLERLSSGQRVVLELAYRFNPWPLPTPEDELDLAKYGAKITKRSVQRREDRERYGERYGVALVTTRARVKFEEVLRAGAARAGEDPRELVTTVAEGKAIEFLDAYSGGKIDAWRRGENPRDAVESMARRGLLWWLRGATISAKTIKSIREEADALYVDAKGAWAVVAPRPDSEGRVWHDQHRRAATGPATAYDGDVDEAGDRESGEYAIAQPPGVPWRRAV